MASSKHAPHRDESRLWKAASAWTSFQHVRDTCDYILHEQIQPDDLIYHSLITAICVFYARPFKRSKGVESLTVQFVPKKFRPLHQLLILVRDQTAAHVDAQTKLLHHGQAANRVRLIVRNRQVRLDVHYVGFKLDTISEICHLANDLIKRMLDYTNKIVQEYPSDVEDGEYLIDLTTRTFRRS
jgi:hypothetical protein